MSTHSLRFTPEKIQKRIDLIRQHIIQREVPIAQFRFRRLRDAHDQPDLDADTSGDELLDWHSYWAGADTHFLLTSEFQVPEGWQEPVALHLPLGIAGDIFSHPESVVYIDGKMAASADRHHWLVRLEPHLLDGKPHTLQLHGWTGWTDWPPDPNDKSRIQMKMAGVAQLNQPLRKFISRAEVALGVAQRLDPSRPERHRLLNALDTSFDKLDTRDPIGDTFHECVPEALATLENGIAASGHPIDVTLHAIGHAHMDIAYLWPVRESRYKNARTYLNILNLMRRHSDFRFSHSQPQLYKYAEEDYPAMFERIKERVQQGRWELIGGMWVEPDLSVPGPEALVRQLLLGRKYFRERFGDVETPVLWLPDTFGFPATMPQLIKQAGLKWFVSNKMSWNQYNRMPNSTFMWRGIDGTEVLTQFLTTPRTVQHLPFPTNYKSDLTPDEVFGTWETSANKETIFDLPICYGYGDGGGGPNDALIRRMRAWKEMPTAPRVKPSTVREFFEVIDRKTDLMARWEGELYLEGHRGTLTSQGWIKRANRKAEVALHTAEFLQVLAGAADIELRETWERLCLNQFHDILTGTSITKVFDEAKIDHAWIADQTQAAQNAALARLSDDGETVSGAALSSIPFEMPRQTIVSQPIEGGQPVEAGTLVNLGTVPAYSLTKITTSQPVAKAAIATRLDNMSFILQNDLVRVTLSPAGELTSVFDLKQNREIIPEGEIGNNLIAFEDRPINWDAWDIDVFIEDHADPLGPPDSVQIIENGPIRAALKLTWTYRHSRIEQRVQLRAGSKRIDFVTDVDWHESHTLLKVAFPVEIRSPRATFDIQWGVFERPTHRNTTWDFARFEVAAHKWADMSEGNYGVALLNDCKYGYDVKTGVMRLSLIKCATMPDPIADQGHHAFTYALLPHEGDWRNGVEVEAHDLNNPVQIVSAPANISEGPFVSADLENIVIETIKPSEDGKGYVVRLFETHGSRCDFSLRFARSPKSVQHCNLLEEASGKPLSIAGNTLQLSIKPFEIMSLMCFV